MEQDNRESWLNRVAIGMAPLFDALDTPLPARVRVAIGFTSRGAKGKAIGECWDNRRSGDGHFEIFIRPDLAHAPHPCPARHRWRDHGTQEAGDGDAQMRVRGVRLYGEDRANGWRRRARPYVRSPDMGRCSTIRSIPTTKPAIAKRLRPFTTKRLSGISRLTA